MNMVMARLSQRPKLRFSKFKGMKFAKILRFILLLLLVIAGLAALSQEKNQPMIWMEATQKTAFTERFSTTLLFQRRVFLDLENTHQHIYWLSGNYKLAPSVTVGGGLIYFTYHRAVGEEYSSIPEYRPFQYITLSHRLLGASFSLRAMIEERYMSEISDGEVHRGSKFNTRYRMRLKSLIPIYQQLQLELSNELLLNGHHLPTDLFGQNRAIARAKYKTGKWEISGGFLHWLVNTSAGKEHRPTGLLGVGFKL